MRIIFLPGDQTIEVDSGTKLLVAARRAGTKIRFGCASCRCGTCAVLIGAGEVSVMEDDERALLRSMQLPTDGTIRLSCQARTTNSDLTIDLDFQNRYSPDSGLTS